MPLSPLLAAPVPAELLERPETHLDSSGFSVGRHAEMIATYDSTMEKPATGALSYVGSFEVVITRRECKRTIEIMQTLVGY